MNPSRKKVDGDGMVMLGIRGFRARKNHSCSTNYYEQYSEIEHGGTDPPAGRRRRQILGFSSLVRFDVQFKAIGKSAGKPGLDARYDNAGCSMSGNDNWGTPPRRRSITHANNRARGGARTPSLDCSCASTAIPATAWSRSRMRRYGRAIAPMTSIDSIMSPCSIANTTFIPLMTFPKTA